MYTVWFTDGPVYTILDDTTNALPFTAGSIEDLHILIDLANKHGFNIAIERCEGGE